jgi:uncharacterized membrane protein
VLEPWTFVIASHAVAACAALVLGAVQILRKTKGDPIHRTNGRVWVALMLYVAASSFLFGGWTQPLDVFLRVLAVWTLFSVTTAVVMARRGNIRRHRGFMVGTYFGLIGAFIGVVAVRTRLVPTWFAAYPLMMSLVAVAILAVSGFLVGAIVLTENRRRVTP